MSSLAQSTGRRDGQGGGTYPAESCSQRSWGAPASIDIANQPLAAEVMAPLPRALFQTEALLCFAVEPEKSAVAHAQRRSWLCQGGE